MRQPELEATSVVGRPVFRPVAPPDERATVGEPASRAHERGLRVGVVERDGVAEVARRRGHGQITIGRSRRNDIVVSDPSAPRRMTLLRLSHDGLSIATAAGLEGEVWLDSAGVTFTLEELREAQVYPAAHHFAALDDHSRGWISAFGKRVVFQAMDLRALPPAGPARRGLPFALLPVGAAVALAALALIGLSHWAGPGRRAGFALDEAPAGGFAERSRAPVTVTPLAQAATTASLTGSARCTGPDCQPAEAVPQLSLEQPPQDGAISDWEGVGSGGDRQATLRSRRSLSGARLAVAERPRSLAMGRVVLPKRAREKTPQGVGGEEFIADGMLTPRAAALEIARRRGALTASFERALRHDPTLAGRLHVRFTVDGAGNVIAVNFLHDTVGDRALREDLEHTLMTWRFPAPESGPVSFTFHLLFRPARPPRIS